MLDWFTGWVKRKNEQKNNKEKYLAQRLCFSTAIAQIAEI